MREYLDKRAAKENSPMPNGLPPMGPSAGQCCTQCLCVLVCFSAKLANGLRLPVPPLSSQDLAREALVLAGIVLAW